MPGHVVLPTAHADPHGSPIAQDQYRGTLRAEGERRPTATRVAERSLGDSLPPDSEQEDDGNRPVAGLARTGQVQRATADAGTTMTSADGFDSLYPGYRGRPPRRGSP